MKKFKILTKTIIYLILFQIHTYKIEANQLKLSIICVPSNQEEFSTAVSNAHTLGYEVYIVDTKENIKKIPKNISCRTIIVKKTSPKIIASALKSISPNFIISLTEASMELAAEVREKLNNKIGNSYKIENNIINKYRTREIITKKKLSKIRYKLTSGKNLKKAIVKVGLPAIVKPLSHTESLGMRLINTLEDIKSLKKQYDKTSSMYKKGKHFLVEEFIEGSEISAEGIVINGKFKLLATTDSFNTGPPYFKKSGNIVPSKFHNNYKVKIKQYVQKIVSALKIKLSPIHAELKLTPNNKIELIELHSHYGGDNIIKLLKKSYDYDVFKIYFSALNNINSKIEPLLLQSSGVHYITKFTKNKEKIHPVFVKYPNNLALIELNKNINKEMIYYNGKKILFQRLGFAIFTSKDHDIVFENVNEFQRTDYK